MHIRINRIIFAPAIVAMMAVCAPATTTAGNSDATEPQQTVTEENDSCAAAFATVMAQYLKPEIEKGFTPTPDSIAEFTRGVAHAFDIKNVEAPYYLGVRSGMAMIDRLEQMQQMGFDISTEAFCRQLQDALTSSAMGFDVKSADQFLRDRMKQIHKQMELPALSAESQNGYLADNKAREGVIETASGLLFEVITEGEGANPTDADDVKVVYTGRLYDGTVFDSTEKPIQFPVAHLVPGFTEGLKLMKPGGEYRIIIPPHLGYGDSGAGGVIPPGAVLDFTIRLVEIVKH